MRNCFSHSLISSSLSRPRFLKEKGGCMQDRCPNFKKQRKYASKTEKMSLPKLSLQCHVGLGGFVCLGFFLPLGYQFGIFNLVCLYLGQSLENINCPLKRDRHSPSIYTYTPTLLFLCPTGRKNETIHNRPKSHGLAEIKHQFSKGFWIQREMPTELQNTLGLTDS